MEHASHEWNLVTDHLDRFLQARDEDPGTQLNLASFLPEQPGNLRRLILTELVKMDLEHGYQGNHQPTTLEQYLERYPELGAPDGVPCDLIYEDFHLRQARDPGLAPDEYYERFPEQRQALQQLLGKETLVGSTQICHRPAPPDIHAGQQLDDFDLLIELGAGSFGKVFLARQQSMQRLVALKVTTRNDREPQTLAQLEHPHIVQVYDQRILPDQSMQLLYMQFVAGGTLAQVIQHMRSLPPGERNPSHLLDTIDAAAQHSGQSPLLRTPSRDHLHDSDWVTTVCRLGIQLSEALHHAHQRGIYHRDIKPANVLLSTTGMALLADFNVSFNTQIDGASAAVFFGGSLAYMSPEQLEACNPTVHREPQDIDGRSDLFSLGIVLWELLLGEHPFHHERLSAGWLTTLKDMVRRRLTERPQPPDTVSLAPPMAALLEVLTRCMAPHPGDRFQDGEQLTRAFQLCLQPHARRLLQETDRNWQGLARRQPGPALLVAILGPNALAAMFNLLYNQQEIITRVPESSKAFYVTVLAVNGLVFPLAILAAYLLSRRLRRRIRMQPSPGNEQTQDRMRNRVLAAGNLSVMASLWTWLTVGIIFPLVIHLHSGTLAPAVYGHFVVSMLTCGLIAAAYPFFLVSFLCLRVFYPSLLDGHPPPLDDRPHLERISRQAARYLLLAGSVPLAGVTLLSFNASPNLLAQLVLSLGGMVGFLVVFRLHRLLQLDIQAMLDFHQ